MSHVEFHRGLFKTKIVVLYVSDICNISKTSKILPFFVHDTNTCCAGNNLLEL